MLCRYLGSVSQLLLGTSVTMRNLPPGLSNAFQFMKPSRHSINFGEDQSCILLIFNH